MAYSAKRPDHIEPLSPGCNKTMYHSREDAEDMIGHIRDTRVTRELRAYRCSTCGQWHLTSSESS